MSRNTHDRTRDHSGTETTGFVTLEFGMGTYALGTSLSEVLLGLLSLSASPRWEVMMTDGISSPPEPMTTEDGTDWLYALIEG